MESEILKLFEDKWVKIILKNKYICEAKVLDVSRKSIVLQKGKTISAIDGHEILHIKEIPYHTAMQLEKKCNSRVKE